MIFPTHRSTFHTQNQKRLCDWLMVSLLFLIPLCLGADEVQQAESQVERWMEVEKNIQSTRTDWKEEQESLKLSINLLKTESERLKNKTGELSNQLEDRKQAQGKVSEELERLTAVEEHLRAQLVPIVQRLVKLEPAFPQPLKQKLRKSRAAFSDPSTIKDASKILDALVTALTEIEQFNDSITVSAELMDIGGKQVQVDTVYLGLAQAYYIDRAETRAGVGIPSSTGWDWEERNDLASAVSRVIRISKNEQAAQFVPLPVSIQP